ncbi:class II aldolase/adducin family protein [Rhodovastum atsumiense]|uniref:class II aldolase/adducin family protein n=1 Tax=Rhodovastum atsumiense TaxID=504468 RepID=UPI00139F29AA|nr:class II aldolase/adducin family protein [Rhodovastum atsumiense]
MGPNVRHAGPGRGPVAALSGRTACLLANHGMVCHGTDIASARLAALRLESLARQYPIASAAGTVRLLTDAQFAAACLRYRSYG